MGNQADPAPELASSGHRTATLRRPPGRDEAVPPHFSYNPIFLGPETVFLRRSRRFRVGVSSEGGPANPEVVMPAWIMAVLDSDPIAGGPARVPGRPRRDGAGRAPRRLGLHLARQSHPEWAQKPPKWVEIDPISGRNGVEIDPNEVDIRHPSFALHDKLVCLLIIRD
jgi:hypothetical protein